MACNKSIAVLLLLLACVDISAMLITPVDTDVILFEPVEITTPTRSVSRIDLGVVVLEYDDSDEGSDDSVTIDIQLGALSDDEDDCTPEGCFDTITEQQWPQIVDTIEYPPLST
jgi:hypothetical protein